jgi:hypothetical protein
LFEDNFKGLQKWVDAKSSKYGTLLVLRERRRGRLGAALKVNFSSLCHVFLLTSSHVIGYSDHKIAFVICQESMLRRHIRVWFLYMLVILVEPDDQ